MRTPFNQVHKMVAIIGLTLSSITSAYSNQACMGMSSVVFFEATFDVVKTQFGDDRLTTATTHTS